MEPGQVVSVTVTLLVVPDGRTQTAVESDADPLTVLRALHLATELLLRPPPVRQAVAVPDADLQRRLLNGRG